MRKTKKMLMGLMLCGAIALAGGVATANAYEAETVSASAETTFTETATGITKIHLRNKRLLLFLDACDYSSTGGTTVVGASYADYNTMDMIQIYTGDTCVTLAEAMATNAAVIDVNVYYNIWGETNSVSYQLDADNYTASNVTKIVIPVGTQFPSYSYTNASGEAVAYTTEATYTFTNNSVSDPDFSTNWSVSVELPTIEYKNVEETSVTGAYVRNGALEFSLSKNDYSVVGGSTAPGEKYASYNFLEKVVIYDAEGNSATWKEAFKASSANSSNAMGCWYNLWTNPSRIAFELSEEWQGKIAKVFIPAGTQFPSAAYTNGAGEALAYEVKQDTYFVGSGEKWQLDYTSLNFTDTETDISMVQWVNNQRLMIWLGENDYGTSVENKVNVNVPAIKLAATNMLEKILVNGTSLKDLGVTSADLNYWTYWGRVSVALTDVAVQTIAIEEGCQFPSMAFAESGAPTRYVNKEGVTYYAVGEADGDVLTCKKSASVTFDGEAVTAYVGMAIPADVIPANPTKESDESYNYTFDGWYNGETKWNIESDVVAGDMALVSKFAQTLRTYTVTFVADEETVGTATYTVEDKTVEEPAVPEKEGYTGEWEAYELTTGDVTVNAIYTEIIIEDSSSDETPDSVDSSSDDVTDSSSDDVTDSSSDDTSDSVSVPDSSEPKQEETIKGCSSVAGMASLVGVCAFAGAALLMKKRKED